MLSPKAQRFFAEYEVDQNGTQAAIRAGYSPNSAYVTASRLLKRAKEEPEHAKALAKAYQDVNDRVSESVGAATSSAAWIVEKAIGVVEYGTSMRPVLGMFGPIINPDTGDPILEMTDPRAATTAMALLAKRHSEFSDKHEITGDVRLRVEALAAVAQMTPDQMRALAEGARGNG